MLFLLIINCLAGYFQGGKFTRIELFLAFQGVTNRHRLLGAPIESTHFKDNIFMN